MLAEQIQIETAEPAPQIQSESSTYTMPDIHVVNSLNIMQVQPQILEEIKNSQFVCIHFQATDAIQLTKENPPNADFYDQYCMLRRVINQSGLISMALSIGQIDANGLKTIIHYQIALCPLTDHNEHPHLVQHLLTRGYDPSETPFAIRYFPGKPKNINHLGGVHNDFRYPEAHTALINIMNALLRPPQQRLLFVFDGLLTLMQLYRHFHTDLPKTTTEFVVDCHDLFGSNIIDVAQYSKLNNFPPDLLYMGVMHGQSVTEQSRPSQQNFPEYSDLYEQQLVESKKKDCVPTGIGNVCEKYVNCGYCELEGACSFSHQMIDLLGNKVEPRQDSVGKTWKVPKRFRTWHVEAGHFMFGEHVNELLSFSNDNIVIKAIPNAQKSYNHELRMCALFGDAMTVRPPPTRDENNKRENRRGGRGRGIRGRGNSRGGRGGRGRGRGGMQGNYQQQQRGRGFSRGGRGANIHSSNSRPY